MAETIEVQIPESAASLLQIDEPAMWPGIETVRSRRFAKGRSYLVRMPVATARSMLAECLDRGNNRTGGEGWDQEPAGKYGCRRVAERLASSLGEKPPTWWR